jgi:hypothetical protein
MDFNQFNWVTGLDNSGWIAAGLFVIFFIITLIVVIMMLKIRADNKKHQRTKPLEDLEPAASKPTRPAAPPAPAKAEVKNDKKEEEQSDPLEQAEIYLDYGLNKQAVDLLEKHLKENPSDKTARELLAKAQQ